MPTLIVFAIGAVGAASAAGALAAYRWLSAEARRAKAEAEDEMARQAATTTLVRDPITGIYRLPDQRG